MGSNDGLKPSCWGPTAWHFLHSVAMGYPENVTNSPEDKTISNNYRIFFESLEFVLPCEWCKLHYKKNLTILPINDYLDGRRNLSLWVYKFHNLVNDETNVPENNRPSFEDVYELYDKYRVPCDQDAKTCGGSGDDLCHMVIKDANAKFFTDANVFSSYWPLILLITIMLMIISVVCLNGKKKK
jgi:hypothetical protein